MKKQKRVMAAAGQSAMEAFVADSFLFIVGWPVSGGLGLGQTESTLTADSKKRWARPVAGTRIKDGKAA